MSAKLLSNDHDVLTMQLIKTTAVQELNILVNVIKLITGA